MGPLHLSLLLLITGGTHPLQCFLFLTFPEQMAGRGCGCYGGDCKGGWSPGMLSVLLSSAFLPHQPVFFTPSSPGLTPAHGKG